MPKKILIIFITIIHLLIGTTLAFSEEKNILPIKKPILSDSEIQKKVSVNIIKPLPKPDLSKEQKKTEVANEENNQRPQYLLPKKKPLIAGINIKPNIDKSKFYSKKDFSLAKKAVAEMKKSKWDNALGVAKKAKDKSIYNFIQWRHLLTKGNKASFYEYLNFINSNPNYPRIGRIKYLAEHKLSNAKIIPGKIILGESYILSGQTDIGKRLIKDGWITAELSKTDLRFFRKKFQKHLNADDYIKRADYLAWENKYWDLERMLRYLPKDYELLYIARQLLMSKSYGVDQAIKNVPDQFKNDAGLNFDRLKWRRKRGRVDSSAEILLNVKNTKDYLVRPDKRWREREIISRSLIY